MPGGPPMDDGENSGPLASATTSSPRPPGRHASGARRGEPDQSEPDAPAVGPRRNQHFWRDLLIIVVAAAALTLMVKAFVIQVYKIPSGSMENTLLVNDRVLVNKVVYRFRGIARGDVIVFSGQDSWGPDAAPPSSNPVVRLWDDVLSDIGLHSSQTFYIKRVIGLPGDRVACCTAGKLTVNGVPLTETSYLYPGDPPSFPFKTVTVPAGHVWVMGDNRSDSEDSRYHLTDPGGGAVPESEVVGRAFLIIWPPSQVRDLPIPSTFSQAALRSGPAGAALVGVRTVGGAALAAVAALPVGAGAGAAGVIGGPLLLLRRRRAR
jgi:signal peptidase I